MSVAVCCQLIAAIPMCIVDSDSPQRFACCHLDSSAAAPLVTGCSAALLSPGHMRNSYLNEGMTSYSLAPI